MLFRSSAQLWHNPTRYSLAELAWRAGLVLAAMNLCLMALAVARINPRVARSGQILLGLFTFIVYYNLINLGQSWIANGQTQWLEHLLLLHGSIAAVSLLLIAMRHHRWHWRWWPSRGSTA